MFFFTLIIFKQVILGVYSLKFYYIYEFVYRAEKGWLVNLNNWSWHGPHRHRRWLALDNIIRMIIIYLHKIVRISLFRDACLPFGTCFTSLCIEPLIDCY